MEKRLNAYFLLEFQVSKERGEELAIEYGIKFMETSAKASINVEDAFFTLARDIKCKMEKRLVRFIFVKITLSKNYYTKLKSILFNLLSLLPIVFLPTFFGYCSR